MATAEQGSGPGGPSEEVEGLRRTLIIVSSVLGATIIAILAAVAVVVLRRRRRNRPYDSARSRDPYLTRPEYADRRRRLQWLTASPPFQEPDGYGGQRHGSSAQIDAEAQRREMIRKSLQSRSMVNIGAAHNRSAPQTPTIPASFAPATAASPATTTEITFPKPVRPRSRTWQGGRRLSSDKDEDDDNDQRDETKGSGGDEVLSAQARVDYMWQLLNRKGGYSPSSASPTAADEEGPALRPPTIRLKTPPLLSHPAFRIWGGASSTNDDVGPRTPKHSSLPTELMSMRPSNF